MKMTLITAAMSATVVASVTAHRPASVVAVYLLALLLFNPPPPPVVVVLLLLVLVLIVFIPFLLIFVLIRSKDTASIDPTEVGKVIPGHGGGIKGILQ